MVLYYDIIWIIVDDVFCMIDMIIQRLKNHSRVDFNFQVPFISSEARIGSAVLPHDGVAKISISENNFSSRGYH